MAERRVVAYYKSIIDELAEQIKIMETTHTLLVEESVKCMDDSTRMKVEMENAIHKMNLSGQMVKDCKENCKRRLIEMEEEIE